MSTCQQNLTSQGSRCGDALDKIAFFITLMFAKGQKIQTKQNLNMVPLELLSRK